jgi:hypothetical protein
VFGGTLVMGVGFVIWGFIAHRFPTAHYSAAAPRKIA